LARNNFHEESLLGPVWTIRRGEGPIVAAAIHDGHEMRPEVRARAALTDPERRHEEDPFTAGWTEIAPHRIVVHRSRFEVDMNRPRDQAVYLLPEQAWGLTVWNSPPPRPLVEDSLADFDAFYAAVFELLSELRAQYGSFVVLDLHSYNYRREGPDAPAAAENPEINVGTGTMDRRRWAAVVDRFLSDLSRFDWNGRTLDVRENVRFRGGHFPRWIHETFPKSGCALAVEVKKFFMDEWTGRPYEAEIERVREALASALPGLLETIQQCPAAAGR
jgi:N-formylglutamate amidohydrolase